MKTDVAIVGGGPGGSAAALFLAQKGISSVIIEKSAFPRFHIGESMTGECGNLTRRLEFENQMIEVGHPVKYGVRVYGPEGKNTFWVPVMRRNPETGELEASSTWQVRRSSFDQMLLETAREKGVRVLEGSAVEPIVKEDGSVGGVCVRLNDGKLVELQSKVLVDASGAAGFLSRSGLVGKKERGNYDNQVAIFSHVTGARRDPEDNTLIFYHKKNHWGWFIPIDRETVSVGVVVPSEHFAAAKQSKRDFFWRGVQEVNPELAVRLSEAELVEEVRAISNYSYHIKNFTGKGFLCVGDSHRFVDPIFSFGLNFAMVEAEKASEWILRDLNGELTDLENPYAEFERWSEQGQDVIQDLIDCFWEQPLAFAYIVHSKYPQDIIDLFAGRIYMEDESPGLKGIRKVLAVSRDGDRKKRNGSAVTAGEDVALATESEN